MDDIQQTLKLAYSQEAKPDVFLSRSSFWNSPTEATKNMNSWQYYQEKNIHYQFQCSKSLFTISGSYIDFSNKILSGLANSRYADCNQEETCHDTKIDELNCDIVTDTYVCQGETILQ